MEMTNEQYLQGLNEFQEHIAVTLDEVYDLLPESSQKFDVTITLNGKSFTFRNNADLYSSLMGLVREEIQYLDEQLNF